MAHVEQVWLVYGADPHAYDCAGHGTGRSCCRSISGSRTACPITKQSDLGLLVSLDVFVPKWPHPTALALSADKQHVCLLSGLASGVVPGGDRHFTCMDRHF